MRTKESVLQVSMIECIPVLKKKQLPSMPNSVRISAKISANYQPRSKKKSKRNWNKMPKELNYSNINSKIQYLWPLECNPHSQLTQTS